MCIALLIFLGRGRWGEWGSRCGCGSIGVTCECGECLNVRACRCVGVWVCECVGVWVFGCVSA